MATDTTPDLAAALPRLDGTLRAIGLDRPAVIRRDAHGIPHVEAQTEHDAWFAMGFACAQDRLWQMEWYRRRGTGRWAELAGPSGLEGDRLFRRLRLDAASRADVEAMSPETREMFDAYADGVNAFIASGQPLPAEYALTGSAPEPWELWHSVLVFKVRHAIMAKYGVKLARTELLRRVGAETYARLEGLQPAGLNVILPPGGATSHAVHVAAEAVARAARDLGALASDEGGSNSWAVHGARTTTGLPVLCNDSHRPLDVPNVYWQAHVTCPAFNVAGGAFPGFPAFPHFGHNGAVAWNITHGQADYQDLYLEEFDPDDPTRYRTESGWAEATVERGEIRVRGAESEPVEVTVTRHGALLTGDPRDGHAIALRYTATDRPNRQWESLRPMLTAGTVAALHESQRGWEEPVNALLSADVEGNIGFLYRGRIPVRASTAGRQFVVPGWTGEHEWTGDVPFESLPQAINPPEGFIGTANQQPWDRDEPYLAFEYATPSRSTRIAEALGPDANSGAPFMPEQVAALQGDTTSVPARAWARFLAAQPAMTGDAERARALLAGWDGDLQPDGAAGLVYAQFRQRAARALFAPIVGDDTWAWLIDPANAGGTRLVTQWMFDVAATLGTAAAAPDGRAWGDVLPPVLAEAWHGAAELAGSADPAAWRWDAVHHTAAQHTLSVAFPDLAGDLDPPAIPLGGDPDTLQVSGYAWSPDGRLGVTSLSVYRQVVDFAEPEAATWVIPGGASGLPATPHYADQVDTWRAHERIPMHLTPEAARDAAAHTLTLTP